MTSLTFDALLHQGPHGWESEALRLPEARLVNVRDSSGSAVTFNRAGELIHAQVEQPYLVARIETDADLISSSTLEQAKLDLERVRLAGEERAGRRTLLVSLLTALVSAGATVLVAWLATGSDRPNTPAASAPPSFRELSECRESLNRLTTLASLPEQDFSNLKVAVARHAEACQERLQRAVDSAPG